MKKRLLLFAIILISFGLVGFDFGPITVVRGSAGASYANVLAGQHFDDGTTGTCLTDEDTTFPNVLATAASGGPYCDATGNPMQGAQYLIMGEGAVVYWDNVHAAVSTGTYVVDLDWRTFIDTASGEHCGFAARDSGGSATYPQIFQHAGTQVWKVYFGQFTSASGAATWTADTNHHVELIYHISATTGSCATLSYPCQNCGCLLVDGSQVLYGDASTDPTDPTGWELMDSGGLDRDYDRLYICNEERPGAARCGDSATFP